MIDLAGNNNSGPRNSTEKYGNNAPTHRRRRGPRITGEFPVVHIPLMGPRQPNVPEEAAARASERLELLLFRASVIIVTLSRGVPKTPPTGRSCQAITKNCGKPYDNRAFTADSPNRRFGRLARLLSELRRDRGCYLCFFCRCGLDLSK